MVTVKLGTGGLNAGKVSVYNLTGNVNVIIDVAGYYKAGTGKAFQALTPGRVLDSRAGSQVGAYSTPWGPGTRATTIGGLVGVPTNAGSVVLNTTVTDTTRSSYLTVWPNGLTQPTASNLNWTAGGDHPQRRHGEAGHDGQGLPIQPGVERQRHHRRRRIVG